MRLWMVLFYKYCVDKYCFLFIIIKQTKTDLLTVLISGRMDNAFYFNIYALIEYS